MAKVGDYNMTSDRSGFVYPRSEMRQEWTGRWVHYSEWEPQQPQEIITPKKDNQRVWPVRDEQAVVNVTITAETDLKFTYADTGLTLSDSDLSVTCLESVSNKVAKSNTLSSYSGLTGVRFTLDKSLFLDTNTFYVFFLNSDSLATSTKSLGAAFIYDSGTDNFVIDIGDFVNGDNDNPVSTHTYNSGDQICVAINNSGMVSLFIGGVNYTYTPATSAVNLTNFSTYFDSAAAGVKFEITTDASIYPTVTDFRSSTIPYIPPSQLDSY